MAAAPSGVLAVQNRTSRVYADDDTEDLQIISMVLAEMVAAGDLLSREELKDVEISPHRSERLKGVRFADGLAFGVAVLHEAPVAVGRLLADDVPAEETRLACAIVGLQTQIDAMLEGHEGILGPSYDVLETYRMLAHSRERWNQSRARRGSFGSPPPKRRSNACAPSIGPGSARRAIPICVNGCTIWRISTIACCGT